MPKREDSAWPSELVELYQDRRTDLVRIAYLMTSRASVAEELVQEAFMSARPQVDNVGSLYAYVRAAVVNNARSWHRRQEVERRLRPAAPAHVMLEADEMWDALHRLEVRRRAAIVLRFYEQLPDSEIAEILGCELPTVRTLVFRGLQDLRKEIER